MIYVLVSVGFKDEESKNKDPRLFDPATDLVKVIKIGFSSDDGKQDRIKAHETSNFGFYVFKLIEGGVYTDENNIHRYFKKYKYLNRREVFMYNEEILKFFEENDTIEKIRNAIPNYGTIFKRLYLNIPELRKEARVPILAIIKLLKKDNDLDFKELYKNMELDLLFYDDIRNGIYKYTCGKYGIDEDLLASELNKIKNLEIKDQEVEEIINKIRSDETLILKDRLDILIESKISLERLYYHLNTVEIYNLIYYFRTLDTLSSGRDDFKFNSIGRLRGTINNNIAKNSLEISNLVHSQFMIGDRVKRSEAKRKLQEIYNKVGLEITAKATDLSNWFEIRNSNISGDRGFEIMSKKT